MIIASIAISSNTEARVTKEVAEVTLPYLMEAAGIPAEQRTKEHQVAILNMIYTDEGQQQMVDWVQQGNFPQKLKDAKFQSVGTYKNETYRDATLASLFPCSTGTFTSFANHKSRLGKHILSSTAKMADMLCELLLSPRERKTISTFDDALYNINLHQRENCIDAALSKIIFVLDICDTKDQIKNVLQKSKIINNSSLDCKISSAEYMCRPVSAILAKNTGDCVETLYRHLITIAIQDLDNKLHIANLPVPLKRYFDPSLQKETIDPSFNTQAGLTSIEKHEKWSECLTEISSGIINCSFGSLYNIAKMLNYIANYEKCRVVDNTKASEEKNLCKLLIDAMNELYGKGQQRFKGGVSKDEPGQKWYNIIVTIEDTIMKRTIKIGICEGKTKNYGHAEILSITPNTSL